MSVRRRIVGVLFAVVVVPLLSVLAWAFAIQPLKYTYLIHGIESAQTAATERAAFRRAVDWGRVWEVDRLSSEDALVRDRRLRGDWLLRVEFLPLRPTVVVHTLPAAA